MGFPLALRLVRLWSGLPDVVARRGSALSLPADVDDERPTVIVVPGERSRLPLLCPILQRLGDPDDGLRVVIAGGFGVALPECAERVISPGQSAARIRQLLQTLKPIAVIVVGNPFVPVWLAAADDGDVPVIAIDVQPARNAWTFWWLARASSRQLLSRYSLMMTPDQKTADGLVALGAERSNLVVTGPLSELVRPPQYRPDEREAIKAGLGARPVWCAVDLPDEEIGMVLQAMDRAARGAHRLMLVVMPRNPAQLANILAAVTAAGHQATVRSDGEDPDTETSVYIADIFEEQGLWFSLANVAYLGGTLSPIGAARSPMQPASLGCAVVHGENYGDFGASFALLQSAGASRQVATWSELGDAIDALSVPDQQAKLAAKAWQISTSSADIAEQLHASLEKYQ